MGRCYELAGTFIGIHESHSRLRFVLSDGSTTVACAKFGYDSLHKQVKLREPCPKGQVGDGIKLFTKKGPL